MKQLKFIWPIAFVLLLFVFACGTSAENIYQEGKTYKKNKEYSKAFDCFTQAMEQGYDSAYSSLAVLYYYGYGVEKNYEKAF